MLKLVRYLTAVLLLVWLGAVITVTFYVAPSLFADESGRVPNSSVAADIIGPLLNRMEWTGAILIPIAIALHWAIAKLSNPKPGRALVISGLLLAAAWCAGLYSGFYLNPELHAIREDLKTEFQGYHLAPPDHPERARFSRLHGVSMSLALVGLGLGLGSFFCVTQSLDPNAGRRLDDP